jgi:Nucleotidyl transferase AbiEii toxin, Type IV TA system
MDARMDNVRLKIQIDFGVGDVIVPGPRMIEYPVLLGGDIIELLAYPVETAIAEKLRAMVELGSANSRMKDFYDVWMCSTHLDFNANTLVNSIDATFKNRQTPLPAGEFEALTPEFARAHRIQWNAFVKKIGEDHLAEIFVTVVEDLKNFAMPVLSLLTRREKLTRTWKAGIGWRAS